MFCSAWQHSLLRINQSINLSLKSTGRINMTLRLFRPPSQCPLEAQREGRDLRDQPADIWPPTAEIDRYQISIFRVQYWPTASSGAFKLDEPTTPITDNLDYSYGHHYGIGSRTTSTEASGALRPIRTSSAHVASPCVVVCRVDLGSTGSGQPQISEENIRC